VIKLILIFSVASIVVGAVGAIDQFKIKRFIGFTTINQMGFILLGLSLQNIYGFIASYVYICIYVILNLIFFSFLINLKVYKFGNNGRNIVYLSDLIPFFKHNRFAAVTFIVLVFSLAGMPPTVGFYMKLLTIKALVITGYFKLAIFVLFINVISIFYYFRIVKIMFFDAESLIFFKNKDSIVKDTTKDRISISLTLFNNGFLNITKLKDVISDQNLTIKSMAYIFSKIVYYGFI
jgi:NADH-quinone oxidoreductase subunit N